MFNEIKTFLESPKRLVIVKYDTKTDKGFMTMHLERIDPEILKGFEGVLLVSKYYSAGSFASRYSSKEIPEEKTWDYVKKLEPNFIKVTFVEVNIFSFKTVKEVELILV